MAKKRLLEPLPQQHSSFDVVGKVTGLNKDGFYKNGLTKKGDSYRAINFGLEYENDKIVYMNLFGMPKKSVWFYKPSETKGQKGNSQEVEWAKRALFTQDGYNVLGVTCGLEKDDNDNNILKSFVEYDGIEYIGSQLRELGEGAILRVQGKIEHSAYTNKKGEVTKQEKFIISRIFLSNALKLDIDKAENKNHYFHQGLVVENIEQDKENERFIVDGYVVDYNNIENVTLYTKDSKLAKKMKNLCAKNSFGLDVYGTIEVIKTEEEEIESDEWGDADETQVTKAPTIRELYITGAKGETLDVENFTKEKIEQGIEKLNKDKKVEEDFMGNTNTKIELETASEEDETNWDNSWD